MANWNDVLRQAQDDRDEILERWEKVLDIKRKNINRGYTKLRVWENSVSLFKLVYNITKELPYDLSKSRNNIIDAAHSVRRNIAEGFCRKKLKEYLNFLNISLGSIGELFSGMTAFNVIEKISADNYEKFDLMYYQVENELIQLIKTLQKKQKDGDWQNTFIDEAILQLSIDP